MKNEPQDCFNNKLSVIFMLLLIPQWWMGVHEALNLTFLGYPTHGYEKLREMQTPAVGNCQPQWKLSIPDELGDYMDKQNLL